MRKLVYKQYFGNTFVRDLRPISQFTISEEINKAGSEIVIELGISLKDTDSANDPLFIVDEDSNFIATEDGDEIIAGTEVLIEGFPNIGDNIKVFQHDDFNPSGVIIFDGLVHRWKTKYSGSSTSLYVRSKGLDLDNYLISILPGQSIAEQVDFNLSYAIFGEFKTPALDRLVQVSQTFTVGADTTINGVYLYLKKTSIGTGPDLPVTISIVEGLPTSPGVTLTSQTVVVSSETFVLTFFQFTEDITLAQSDQYHFSVKSPFGTNLSESNLISIYYNSAGGYPDGQVYLTNDVSGITTPGTDLYFQLVTTTVGLGNIFNSQDPSTIFTALINNYVSSGGQTNYDETSIAATNTLVSYTFRFNTYLEGLDKLVELAPPNWFYYVSASTNIVYFDKVPEVPDHYLTFGKEVLDIDIEYTLEKMTNLVYVIGAEQDNGTSLVAVSSDTNSIGIYGQKITAKVDTRITLETTAKTLANNLLIDNRNPSFIVIVDISGLDYNITSIRIGQLIAFRNFIGLVGDLELQVVGKVYTPESVKLYLSKLPPSQAKRIEDINRNLKGQQTENIQAD